MPFGRKPKENKSKANQNDHPQPILNVDFPETKPNSNSDPIATWDTLGKDGDQDRQRRPSKTSGASREETSFGPDVFFDQDVTPPPGRKKPTLKSMGHKIAKTFGGNKGASNSEDEHPTSLSPTTCSQVPDEATTGDVHSPRDVGGIRNGSGLVGVSEHPLLSSSRIPTLESYIEPSQDKVGGTAPQLEKAGSAAAAQQRDTSPSTAGPLSNTPGKSEEQIATHRLDSSGDKKQEDGLAHAAQGLRNTSQDVLGKKMVENRKWQEELKLLRDELAAKETTRKDLETKLDEKDIAHYQHLEARLSDVRAAHKIELEAKQTLLQAALTQKENDRQTAADELAKREAELKDDLKNKEVEYQNALTQKENDRQTAADELGKREAELEDDLKNKDVEYQNVLKMFVAKDAELLSLKEEMRDKETVAKTLTHDLEEKLKQLELQARMLEQTDLAQLEDARKQSEQSDQVVMEMTQGQGASQGSLKAQIETEIEAKYQQKIEESQRVNEEELTRQANEIEHLSQQLKNAENETQKVQESKKTMQDAEHLLMQEAKRKEQEIERLSNELESQVEILARFEHENEHLKGQYRQLEVHAQAKQELSVASFIPSERDDGDMFHTPPVQRAVSAAAVARDTEVEVSSSLVAAANQISKFIDNEAFLDRAKEIKLNHEETVAITQAIGLPAPTKRLCYVFAVFPTNLHDHSVVLDYTGGSQTGAELEGVVEAAHQHGADGGGEEEEQFFEALPSQQMADDNRTDAEKLKEVVKESEGLRDELERLTIELTSKEQELEAANAHFKEVECLHGNLEVLNKQVQELKATNAELNEVVRAAAVEVPASPVGVQQGEDTGKMLKQMRARYLEQVTKTLEDQEKYEKEQEDLVQQHKREKQEWWTRYENKRQELIAKLEEKNKENKQLRNRSPTQTHPELGRSFSYEEPPEDVDPRVHIGQLKQALKSREETIEELNVQVRSFQEIASQHKQLENHSKVQSTTVMNLRRELEKTQAELAVARSESESAKKIQEINSKVSEVNLELEQLQRDKNEIEDERDILKNEICAERKNNDSLKKQLAQSQTMVTALRTRTTEPVGVDHKDQEIQILKTEENLYQKQLAQSQTMVTTLGTRATEPVGIDDKDQEIQLLKTEANLYQIELEDLRRNAARSKQNLTDLGHSKFSLERKLANVRDERDRLAQQNLELQAVSQEVDHPGTGSRNETENLQRSSPVLSGSGTERGKNKEELAEMHKTNEQQRLHILELEQKIGDLELGVESLRIEIEKGQAHFDKLTRDHIGVVDHSKRQSKKVMEYKDRLKIMEELQNDLEAELEVATKQINVLLADKSHLDGAFRKLTTDKAKLVTEVKTLRDKGQKFARTELEELEKAYKESQERVSRLESDLTRIRRERDHHKERSGNLEEIERTCNHYQQKTVGQQAMLENLQKDLGDSRRKVTQLTSGIERQQTEFQQVSRQRDEVFGECEAHRLTAQTFQEDFQAERQEREKAHSKAAEMEQRFTNQIQALANELQQKAKENDAVQQALANQKCQFEVQMSSLNYQVGQNKEQGGRLQDENRKLQEEIQSKTQQVKQYKKQVDQFRVEVEASKEQAEVHRAQVETSVTRAENLARENDRLRRDNENLNARLRHAGATSVDPRQSPVSDQLKRENEDLRRQAAKYMETINELNMRSGLLQSELEELKKGRGVASSQALPNHPRISEPLRQQIVNRPLLPSQGAIRPSYQPPPHTNQPSHQPHTGQPSQPPYPFVSQHHSHTSHQPHPPSSHQGQPAHAQRQQFQQSKAMSVDDSHLHSRGTHQNIDQGNGHFLQTGREQPRYVDNSRLSVSDSHSYRHHHTADLSLSTNVARANNFDNRYNTGNLLDGTRSPSSNADIRTPAGQNSRTNQPPGTNADSAARNPPMRLLPSSENPNRYPVYDNLPLTSGFGPQGPASLPLSAALGSPSPTHDRQAFQYGGGNGFQKQQLGQMQGRPGEGNPQLHQTPDIVDKDSPPASYQPSSLNIQQNQGNHLRAQFAGKPQGMTKSADGYLQPSSHARSQQARPLPTPRVQVEYGNGGPPYAGGADRQLQGYQRGQGGQLGSGNVSYYNPPRAVSAQVKYPQQESRVELGPEQSRERLPAPLRSHSQNVYNPQMQGGRVGGRYIQKDMPGMGTHVEENSQNSGESSLESNQSNALDKGIDQDIKQAAKKLEKQVSGEESMAIEGDSVPFDPNLVCPYCKKQFRLGEIQKFRRHADSCDRKR